MLVYIYIYIYEHEAVQKTISENNIGAPLAPQNAIIIYTYTSQLSVKKLYSYIDDKR